MEGIDHPMQFFFSRHLLLSHTQPRRERKTRRCFYEWHHVHGAEQINILDLSWGWLQPGAEFQEFPGYRVGCNDHCALILIFYLSIHLVAGEHKRNTWTLEGGLHSSSRVYIHLSDEGARLMNRVVLEFILRIDIVLTSMAGHHRGQFEHPRGLISEEGWSRCCWYLFGWVIYE